MPVEGAGAVVLDRAEEGAVRRAAVPRQCQIFLDEPLSHRMNLVYSSLIAHRKLFSTPRHPSKAEQDCSRVAMRI
jgi:hypothetical protein